MLTSPVAAARAAVATGAWVKSKHDIYLVRGSVAAKALFLSIRRRKKIILRSNNNNNKKNNSFILWHTGIHTGTGYPRVQWSSVLYHNEAVFCLWAKKPLHTGGPYRVPLFISLSVCQCVTFVVFTDCENLRGRFSQTRDLWKRASMG